jgi:outer membrane lipoprotein-sorting protein
MNATLKHITLLLSIAAIVMIGACSKKKDDFRDSLVGNYNCIEHYSYTTLSFDSAHHYIWGRGDTTLGPASIAVTKLANDDSSIVMNGQTFTFSSSNTTQTQYWTYGFNTVHDNAYFISHNDSLWFSNTVSYGVSHWDFDYYAGRKQ